MNKHTISVLVENEFGVLTRVAGLFSGRGYNIESLSVAPTLDSTLSRMTIITSGPPNVIEQIIKHLNKLINVIKVQDVTAENPLNRMLAFVKVNLGRKNQLKLKGLIRPFRADIAYFDDRCSIVQVVAEEERIRELIDTLKPYGIMEYVATGNLAIQKGKKVI
jgi:acetolactate synthase-1/3 small subunit